FIFHNHRRGSDIASALPRIINVDLPHQAPGLLIEGDHIVVLGAEEDFAIADCYSTIPDKAWNTAGHGGVSVVPDLAPGCRVQSEYVCLRSDQIHHAVDHNGCGLQVLRVVPGLEHPSGRE